MVGVIVDLFTFTLAGDPQWDEKSQNAVAAGIRVRQEDERASGY
jgi:hypothetical protein